MARTPSTEVNSEVSRVASPFARKMAPPSVSQEEPLVPEASSVLPDPIEAPEPSQRQETPVSEVPVDADTQDRLSELANLFNGTRKIQVGTAIPSDLYLKICRIPGGVPSYFRKALEDPLDPYEVMLGAKRMGDLRKHTERTTITPKIEPEQYARVTEIVERAQAAGIGLVTEAKVVAGILYCRARREGLV